MTAPSSPSETLRDSFVVAVELWNKQAIEFLKEAGLYQDFLEWQKKYGAAAPVLEDK